MIARCWGVLARVNEVLGYQLKAAEAANTGLALALRVHDLEGAAALAQFLAYEEIQYGVRFDASRRSAQQAIAYGTRSGNVLAVGWAELNLAQLAVRLSDGRTALRHIDSAQAVLRTIGDVVGMGAAFVVAGDAAQGTGQYARAAASYDSAAALYARLNFGAARPSILFRQASLELAAGHLDEATARLDEGVSLAQRYHLAGLVDTDAHYLRGALALRRSHFDVAIRELQTYLGQFTSLNAQYLFDGRMRLAEAYASAGRLDDAVRTLDEGFLALDRVRSYLDDRDARVVVLQSRRLEFDPDLGIATIVNTLARAGRLETAFRVAEAQRSRYLWEQVVRRGALAGDIDASSAKRAERLVPVPMDIDQLRTALPDSTAVIEYVTGRGNEPTTAFVVSAVGAWSISMTAADSLVDEIDRFTQALQSGARAGTLARLLAQAVLDPALALLPSSATRIVLVPDGPLHRLPFDALTLRDGRAVLEHYTLTLSPSSRLARAFWAAAPDAHTSGLLALGGAVFPPASGLAPLNASAAEVRAIGRLASPADIRVGERASESALKHADWTRFAVLHLATHAQVEDWGVLSSALFLSAGDGEDGRMGVEEIAGLPLDEQLVVLSACRTVGGALVSGEGIEGLTAPFLEAGARAVAATYWPISDRAIVALMTGLYTELGHGLQVGDALRQAKLASLRAGDPPSVWASLTLTGDGRMRPRLR